MPQGLGVDIFIFACNYSHLWYQRKGRNMSYFNKVQLLILLLKTSIFNNKRRKNIHYKSNREIHKFLTIHPKITTLKIVNGYYENKDKTFWSWEEKSTSRTLLKLLPSPFPLTANSNGFLRKNVSTTITLYCLYYTYFTLVLMLSTRSITCSSI